MKITALKQQVKNKERVSIFVDEKYSFSLSLDELVSQKLKKDDELIEGDVKRLKKLSVDGKLRMRSMEWLLNRPHSTREFRNYLYRKKAEPETIDAFVEDFTTRKYLDDYKFGEWLIELHKRRGKSNRAIKNELFKKGVSREISDELLASDDEDEIERLKSIIAKKQKLTRYQQDPQKLAKYLTSQGFSWEQVKQVLKSDAPED